MLEYTQGDILKCHVDAIVNPVNCVGVMGRGLALQFKEAYPENFKAYAKACKQDLVRPGHLFVFEMAGRVPRLVVNFPTKRHWREPSRIEDIEAGLVDLVDVIHANSIRSIAVPPLGAGLGGLEWGAVRQRIERTLAVLTDIRVIVFEPAA